MVIALQRKTAVVPESLVLKKEEKEDDDDDNHQQLVVKSTPTGHGFSPPCAIQSTGEGKGLYQDVAPLFGGGSTRLQEPGPSP